VVIIRLSLEQKGPFYVDAPEITQPSDVRQALNDARQGWVMLGGVTFHRNRIRYIAPLDELPAGEHLVTAPPARILTGQPVGSAAA
jgi:hypothetical protein